MLNTNLSRLGVCICALGLTACGGPIVHELVPLPGNEETAPEITRKETVVMQTTAGEITIDVYPEAAPNAAARFIELVESGFYDGTPVFRIVPGFVAQFGINWRDGHRDQQNNNFNDDEGFFRLARGTLAFAKTQAPNSASTQIFINFADNSRLAATNFQTFGMIVEGIEVIDAFVDVGELSQPSLWSNGEAFLEQLNTSPTMIESAKVD